MVQSMQPQYDGMNEGDRGWGSDGSAWIWRHKKGEPNRFQVSAAHLPLYGQPLATGLYPEEMSAMLLWLMKDPRCTKLGIEVLPRAGEWVLEVAAPEPIETEESALVAEVGHVAIP